MNQNFTINNIYNINYTDQDSVINNVIVGRPINNGVNELFSYRERDIIELAVNPNDPNIDDIFDMAFNNDDVSFTMGIDYRLLNRHVVDLLIDAYSHDNIRGIRILPRGKKLTSDIYHMLNTFCFAAFRFISSLFCLLSAVFQLLRFREKRLL
jgi:hypothetical protein